MRNGEGGMLGRALRSIRFHTIAVLVLFLLLFAAGDTFAQSHADAGRTLARQWCSSCHLVEMGGYARDAAPPFSTLAQQRGGDLNWIRTRMQVPLYPMQGINLSRSQIDDIVAYFESLRTEALPVAPRAATAQSTGDAVAGRIYAETHCAQCHAVAASGESPYSPAPAFRTLYTRYPVENLAEALAEGIGVGHRGEVRMPEFVLTPEEIDNLLAYLTELGQHGNGAAATQ